MNSAFVNPDGSGSLEGFAADITLVGSLVRVNLPVQNQFRIVFEHFAAGIARIFGQMRQAMDAVVVDRPTHLE